MRDTNKIRIWCIFMVFRLSSALQLQSTVTSIDVIDPPGDWTVETFWPKTPDDNNDIPTLEGFIAMADPSDACTSLSEPPFVANVTAHKFVLIDGNNTCTLQYKIVIAEQAGYDAAILFGQMPASPWNMGNISIPVMWILGEDAAIIQNRYLYNSSIAANYLVRISSYSLILSYISIVFCLALAAAWLIVKLMDLIKSCCLHPDSCCIVRFYKRHVLQERIRSATFKTGSKYEICSICREEYEIGEKIRILACHHDFHKKCIDRWIIRHRGSCPICRKGVMFEGSYDTIDSESRSSIQPSETAPLLNPQPSNPIQSFGTIINPPRSMQNSGIGRPSSLPANLGIHNILENFAHTRGRYTPLIVDLSVNNDIAEEGSRQEVCE